MPRKNARPAERKARERLRKEMAEEASSSRNLPGRISVRRPFDLTRMSDPRMSFEALALVLGPPDHPRD